MIQEQDFKKLMKTVEQNHKMLVKMRRKEKMKDFAGVLKAMFLVGALMFAYLKIQPFLQKTQDTYEKVNGAVETINETQQKIEDTQSKIFNFGF